MRRGVHVVQALLRSSTPEVILRHRQSLDSRDNGSVIPDSPLYGTVSGRVSRAVSLPARERSFLHSMSDYLMKQTYIAMLIVMMVMLPVTLYLL